MKQALIIASLGIVGTAFSQATSPMLYVTNNVSGSVSAFSRGADGSLSFVGIYSVGTNPQDCGLTLDGRNLVVINAGIQTVEEVHTFIVNADGSLSLQFPPSTVGDGPLSLSVTNTNYALVPSATADNLTSFHVTGDNTSFVQAVPAGVFPTKVLAAPNSKLAFLTDATADVLRTFTVSNTGMLAETDIDSLAAGSLQGLAISPDGLTLYASTALMNIVYWLSVDYQNNSVTEVSSAASGGNSCVELAMHPQGTYLYVCNVVSDTLTVMAVAADGSLTNSVHSYLIGNDIRDVVTDGRYVYVTDESSISSSPVGVIVFRIESDGQLTRLTTNVTGGGRPQFMQLWDPNYNTLPYRFEVTRGIVTSGTRQDTVASDDLRMAFRPGVTFSTLQAPVELTLSARSPFANPAELRFQIEAQATSANVRQTVLMYDWDAQVYVQVDERQSSVSDAVVNIARTDANRFIDDVNQTVRAKVLYRATGPVFAYPWETRIDRTAWSFAN
jgi:6-phosphogluconolactonase (cycloisomerase 2 family)